MKSNFTHNSSGINISDSIIMSVRNKKRNMRIPLMTLIAVCGFVSVILSFLGMFRLNYDRTSLAVAASVISAFYITLTIINKKALWVYSFSILVFIAAAYRYIGAIIEGFKFVYNIIYMDSFKTKLKYYKYVNQKDEYYSTTVLLIFAVWLLAIVIYYFTICRPNPILPLFVTFPIIEIGLYNGIEIPVFWGMLVVAYWLALLAMSMIDVGEYDGGSSGFVRKDNLFFPKRKMKLKVTGSCGIFVVAAVMLISGVTSAVIRYSGYERSDELNQKRKDLTHAFDEFTFDNIPASLARIGDALGFRMNVKSNKLGSNDHIEYDNETDLIVEFTKKCNGAVYLKEEDFGIYEDNEWKKVEETDTFKQLMNDFKSANFYPQVFNGKFTSVIFPDKLLNTAVVKPQTEDTGFFSPYGIVYSSSQQYNGDSTVKSINSNVQWYDFYYVSTTKLLETIARKESDINPSYYYYDDDYYSNYHNYWDYDADYYYEDDTLVRDDELSYIDNYDDYIDYIYSVSSLHKYTNIENKYRKYVYNTYLEVPDTRAMDELKERYRAELSLCNKSSSVPDKIKALNRIKERITNESSYTLAPGRTPSSRDFVNYFLLENHKGYCVHYASAGVILARMAGIPARYATGYVIVENDFGSSKNSDKRYTVDVKDNRSHAWAEIYLDNYGWVPFEFTAGYSEQSIGGEASAETTSATSSQTTVTTAPAVTTTASQLSTSDGSSLQTTTAETTDTVSGIVTKTSDSDGNSKTIPLALKITIISVLSVLGVLGAVLLRRSIIIRIRRNKFSRGNTDQRLGCIYDHCEKLLSYLKLNRDNLTYTDFAEKVENRLGGSHFDKESFRRFMDISLRSGFSNSSPDESEINTCLSTVTSLENSIYRRSGFFAKIYLKYIKVLL